LEPLRFASFAAKLTAARIEYHYYHQQRNYYLLAHSSVGVAKNSTSFVVNDYSLRYVLE
jgi:hypothetical protein